ncbi:MAG: magnesium transporter [Gammaproteobacteria bacterium]|nr:magnesium transporter [Gammaproteobacteria bacterium]MBU2056663.1 magnesium transporter [Gammaproteobacteria bacterium]MBU2174000.1 magnesium transporter [Gammaproteobacteria bacterium]MBU2247306.1 magnesium transporter [Gammaproteobacteria bacterium]MBU2345010.1 magnesium transporter [Gammaproteobacteria bacterium]
MVENTPLDIEEIVRDSFDENETEQLAEKLDQLEPEEIAIALEAMPLEQRVSTWLTLEKEQQIASLTYMRVDARSNIFKQLETPQLHDLVEEIDVDDLIELLDELPDAIYQYACSRMDQSEKRWLDQALTYDDEQCGRYADHDVLIVSKNAKVRDAVRLFKKLTEDAEYQEALFVVDRTGRYVGLLQGIRLLGQPNHMPVVEFIDAEAPVVQGDMELDTGSDLVARSGYSALAVVDGEGKLLGRLSIGEALENVRRSLEGQFMHTAGLDEEEDLFAPIVNSAKRRALWLGINLLTAFLAAWTIGLFEATLQQVVALAVLMPIVASMGGIAGSQTLTLIIRGLALGQITPQTYWTLMRKELSIGAINGVLWALVIAGITYLWFGDWIIAGVISFAIVINICVAALSGVVIPVWLEKMKIDPALSGSVILTTVTDVIGFFAFLGLGSLFLL